MHKPIYVAVHTHRITNEQQSCKDWTKWVASEMKVHRRWQNQVHGPCQGGDCRHWMLPGLSQFRNTGSWKSLSHVCMLIKQLLGYQLWNQTMRLMTHVHHSSHDDDLLNYHTQVNVQSNSTTLHTMERSQQKESIYKLQKQTIVSTTEWLPSLAYCKRSKTGAGEGLGTRLWLPWLQPSHDKLCKQPEKQVTWCLNNLAQFILQPKYTDNPQNICEGVFTYALQRCSKELSCKQVIPSQMLVVNIIVVRWHQPRAASSQVALCN